MALSGAAYAAKTTLAKNQVKAKNVAREAITAPKLKNGAVTAAKIASGAVVSSKLANNAVRSAALGGSVVTTAKLKNDGVTAEKIATSAVTNSKLGPDAISTGKVQDGAVTATKLAPAFNAQLAKNVSYAFATSASNSSEATKSATAICPSGKKVIGGGAHIVGSTTTVAITRSAPPTDVIGMTTGPDRWQAGATAIAAEASAWAVEAFAVCAEL